MKRIIVRSPNWVGDQILAYPFFYYLRQSYPDAWITVVCVSWVESIQYRNLVNEVLVLPRGDQSTWKGSWELMQRARKQLRARTQGWDLGFILPQSFSSAWIFTGVKIRKKIGYRGDGRRYLLHRSAPAPVGSRAQTYLELLNLAGVPGEKKRRDALSFFPQLSNSELQGLQQSETIPGELPGFDFARAWTDSGQLPVPAEPFWILAPGSMAESRRWGIERFGELAVRIAKETGWSGFVVGGPQEAPLAQRLVNWPGARLKDWTAQGGVAVLAQAFSRARFTVANDSGLAHVAALCGSPTCIVWGAGDPKVTAPLGPGRVRTLFSSPECWPCAQNICRLEGDQKLACLRGTSVERVWEEIRIGLLQSEVRK